MRLVPNDVARVPYLSRSPHQRASSSSRGSAAPANRPLWQPCDGCGVGCHDFQGALSRGTRPCAAVLRVSGEQRLRLGNRAICPRSDTRSSANRPTPGGIGRPKKDLGRLAMYKLISIILAAIPVILFLRTIFIGQLKRSQSRVRLQKTD